MEPIFYHFFVGAYIALIAFVILGAVAYLFDR